MKNYNEIVYELGQRVMAAAGCTTKRRGCLCDGQECRSPEYCDGMKPYPDPRTSEGHAALWDALEKQGWSVRVWTHPPASDRMPSAWLRRDDEIYEFCGNTREEALLATATMALHRAEEVG